MRLILLSLTFLLSVFSLDLYSQTPAANKRAMRLLRDRKELDGLPINIVLESLAGEDEPNLVWLTTGLFLNQKNVTAEQLVQVLSAATARENCFYQIVAQVALSKHAGPCVDLLLANKAVESKLVAATIMAIRSQLNIPSARSNGANSTGSAKGGKGNKGGKSNALRKIDFTSQIRPLLNEKNRDLVELAIVAAAHCGAQLDDEVDAVQLKKAPAVEAAKALYCAKRGRALPESIAELVTSRIKSDRQYQQLSAALSTFKPTTHPLGYVAQAIGISQSEDHLELLHQLLSHQDIRVQVDAAIAIEKIGNSSSIDPLLAALPEASWPAKVRIYSALGAIPDKKSVPVLLEQLANEPGRLRLDCTYALASIFGNDVGGDATAWQAAWDEIKGSFKINVRGTREFRKENKVTDVTVRALGTFYDLGIYSSNFLYVVDTSASMKGDRIRNLEQNLSGSAHSLKEPARFNIVMFGGEINVASNQLETATQGNYIADQIRNLKLSYATRTYDAIHLAGQFDEADTIYFLSDGAPVHGSFAKWSTIIPAYRYLHRYRPIAIFTVPYSAGENNAKAMKRFSTQNFGTTGGLDEGG